MRTHHSVKHVLVKLWNGLTQPSAAMLRPEHQRQARLLAALFLLLLPIGLFRAALPVVTAPAGKSIWQLPEFRALAITSVFVLFAYGVARTRYYALAAASLVILSSGVIFAAAIPLALAGRVAGFNYLVLPVLFAGIFFSVRLALAVALINLTGILVVPLYVPGMPDEELYFGPFSFIAIVSLVILLMTYYRNSLEHDRQTELAASEARYRSLVENAPIAIYTVINVGDQVLMASLSPGFEKMTGWSASDWIGKSFAELIHPDDISRALESYQRVMQGQTVPAYELRIRARSGEYLVGEFIGTPYLRDGVIVGELGVARDITERRRAEQQLHQRTAQLESMRQIGLEITAELHLDTLLHSIIRRAAELTEADGGGLYLYDPARDVIVRRVSVGNELVPVGTVRRRGESVSGKIFAIAQPLLVQDYAASCAPDVVVPTSFSMPVVGVPIFWGNELLGVLTLGRQSASPFQPADIELLEMVASYAATAIHNARTLEAEERAHQRAAALASATAVLTGTLEIAPLLADILQAAVKAIDRADKGSVLLVDQVTGDLCVRATIGYHDPRVQQLRLSPHEGYTRRALETGVPVLLPNLQNGEWQLDSDISESQTLQSAVVAPLRYHDRIIGVISLDNASHPAAFDQNDAELLGAFANQAAAAIENARLHQRIAVAGTHSAVFANLGHGLNAATNPEQAARIIFGTADDLLGWDACYLDLYEASQDRITSVLFIDTFDGRRVEYSDAMWVTKPTEIIRRMLREGAQLILRDKPIQASGLVPFGNVERLSASLMFVPIRQGDNVIGILSIQSYTPNAYDRDALTTLQALADMCGNALERIRAEEQIRASLREKEVLLKEIHHRVKNNLQVVSSLLNLQTHQVSDPVTLEMLRDGQNRVRSMALIHERLYKSQNLARIDLAEYIQNLAGYLFRAYNANTRNIRLHVDVAYVELGIDMAIPCGLILNELISNALKHAFPGTRAGEIRITLTARGDQGIELTVADDGVGFPPNVDYRKTASLGLQLVNTLVNQLNGTYEIKPGAGTVFTIRFTPTLVPERAGQ